MKNCPFCGGEGEVFEELEFEAARYGCLMCGVWLPLKWWDTRASGWIPVESELPTDWRDVLVLQKGGFKHIGRYDGEHHMGWNHINVTHWQELPGDPT